MSSNVMRLGINFHAVVVFCIVKVLLNIVFNMLWDGIRYGPSRIFKSFDKKLYYSSNNLLLYRSI